MRLAPQTGCDSSRYGGYFVARLDCELRHLADGPRGDACAEADAGGAESIRRENVEREWCGLDLLVT